ncbi:MAG: hypothetical protein DRP33_06375 [Thermotogae bacterium]|nr:MAG: hypothetical protein DRP33_06375 [Thermotogota bacterium]
MMRVFISHSSKDEKLVESLKKHLEKTFKDVCYFYTAADDPQPGQNLAVKIQKEIEQADVFLVLLTPNSKKSSYVNQEIGYAKKCGKRIIALVMKGTPQEALGMLAGDEYIIHIKDEIPESLINVLIKEAIKKVEENQPKQALDPVILAIIVVIILFLLAFVSEK